MATNEVYAAAKAAFTFHNSYLKAVGEEIGMSKAIALQSRMCEAVGTMQGKIMREQAGGQDCDAKTAYAIVKAIPETLGILGEVIEEDSKTVRFECGKCSVYAGAMEAGIDERTRETICRDCSVKYMDSMVKQLNPRLSFRLAKFRSSPDDICIEEIVSA